MDARHRRAAQAAGVGGGQGAGQPVEPGVSARRLDAGHRASRPIACDSRRRAGPDAHLGRSGGEGAAPERPDGRRAAPALRREPVDLPDLQQAPRRRHAGHGAGAREVRRQDPDRGEGDLRRRAVVERRRRLRVARRLRPRRHVVHDHRLVGREGHRRAGHHDPQGQDPPPARRRLGAAGQPVRRQGRLQARNLQLRPPQFARADRPSRDRRAVEHRKRPQRRRRNQHRPRRPELRLAHGQHGAVL